MPKQTNTDTKALPRIDFASAGAKRTNIWKPTAADHEAFMNREGNWLNVLKERAGR